MEALIPLAWIFFAIVIGLWVSRRGRSGLLAGLLALLLSPLAVWIVHLAIGAKVVVSESNAYDGPVPGAATSDDAPVGMKRCPACAELILMAARKCRYCGEYLTDNGLEPHDG